MKKIDQCASVSIQFEGVHCFPAAAIDPKLAAVSFISKPHRHIFHITVEIQLFHDDRDIEFILFKRWLKALYKDNILELDHQSCEMISDNLANKIEETYPGRKLKIHVFEDGENGSITEYQPDIFKSKRNNNVTTNSSNATRNSSSDSEWLQTE
jgi:hypothetical protein